MRSRGKEVKPTVATHFPSRRHGFNIDPNIHMFMQDVQLAVMPIGGRTDRHPEFAVSLVGTDADREKAKQLIGEIGQYDRRDLAGMVCEAVEQIAQHLAWEGCSVYEIILDNDGFPRIWGFTSRRLLRLPGIFLQLIPRKDWELWKKKVVVIPASRVWCLEMPLALGGRRGYNRVLNRLKRFNNLGPEFWRRDLEHGFQSQEFDFQRYNRSSEIYYGQVTKKWGWNRRDWSQERCTEFFTFYKMIRFKKAQAVLREHIVAEFNRLFARLEIHCKLQVAGLPTAEDLQQIERQLMKGDISFGAASNRVMV